MLEACLQRKIIRHFLNNYTENRWSQLIPSLIEIGILYLQNNFNNKTLFTDEEIHNIIQKNDKKRPPLMTKISSQKNNDIEKNKKFIQRSYTPENSNQKHALNKISYVISYDKKLLPESIEKKINTIKSKNCINKRNNKKYYKKVHNKIIKINPKNIIISNASATNNNFKNSGGFINTLFQKIDNKNNNYTDNLVGSKEELLKFIQENKMDNINDPRNNHYYTNENKDYLNKNSNYFTNDNFRINKIMINSEFCQKKTHPLFEINKKTPK